MLKLDSLCITTVVYLYGVILSAAENFDGMFQVTDKYVVMKSGIYDKKTGHQVYSCKGHTTYNSLILTKSENIISSDSTKLYVEIGALS